MTDDTDLVPASDPAVPWAAPVEPRGPAPGVEFAPHGARFVAYLLDSLVLFTFMLLATLLAFVTWYLFAGTRDTTELNSPVGLALALIWVLIVTVVSVGYFPFFWQRSGQTPGMRPFRLWVVRDKDGVSFGWGTASLRLLGLYVASSVFYLGFIWIFIDKRRRGWHDLIAGTVVVRRDRDQTG